MTVFPLHIPEQENHDLLPRTGLDPPNFRATRSSTILQTSGCESGSAPLAQVIDTEACDKGEVLLINQVHQWISQATEHWSSCMGTLSTNSDQFTLMSRVLLVLGITAEETRRKVLISGCWINPNLQAMDTISEMHAIRPFSDQPAEKVLEALQQAREQLFALRHLLQCLVGDGDPAKDIIATWTGHYTRQTREDAPGLILSKHLLHVKACLGLARRRIELISEQISSHKVPTAPQAAMTQSLLEQPETSQPRRAFQPFPYPDTTAGTSPLDIKIYTKGRFWLIKEVSNWIAQIHITDPHDANLPEMPARVL